MRNKIQDQYTNLPVRQRKWQLRNPDKDKAIKKKDIGDKKMIERICPKCHLRIKKVQIESFTANASKTM